MAELPSHNFLYQRTQNIS